MHGHPWLPWACSRTRTCMDTLGEIAHLVRACTDCELHNGRTNSVPGEGAPDAELMFIGEGPGYQEDRQGRPFVGPAGQFLEELLGSIGLTRGDVFIANMVKCRPPRTGTRCRAKSGHAASTWTAR